MWFSKIELTCFKSYQHQEFIFPGLEKGKNVVLIGGMNGYGKTTILEAIYLCLYGKDAIIHLSRAGLKTDDIRGYPTFLERAFNGEARREGRDTMVVRVLINKTKTKAVDISRRWYFRSNGSWSGDEETVVKELNRGVPGTPRVDGRNNFYLSDMLDGFFIPAHVAPFFFFDGEEVKKLSDQGRVEQVKQGLEGLLGVVLLRTLSDRLRSFEAKKRSEVITVDKEKLDHLYETLKSNEINLKSLKEKAEELEEKKSNLRGERESLIERITAAGGAGSDVATVKDLVEEREQYRNKLRQRQKKLEDLLSGRLPFHLASKELLEEFRKQVESEICYFNWSAEKQALEPRKLEFEEAFFSEKMPEITPGLTGGQIDVIKQRLDAAWASLFYPPPDECADKIIHTYLYDSLRQKTLDFLDSIQLGKQEIRCLLNEQNELLRQIEELGRRVSKLDGIDRDGTLSALKNELHEVQEKLDKLFEESRTVDRKMQALESQMNAQKAEYERERKKLDESSPAREIIIKSTKVRSVINKVVPELFPLKVKKLARAMTEVYKSLAHKNQVAKIQIENDGSTRVLGKSGKEISFDRSAGENQIFATALIAGLAKVSGVKAPMVVDTPLGRLDSKHRMNILNFWTSEKNRQIILLSQDEEIDNDFYRQIKESVSKTYLLEYMEVGDGIGRSTAKENEYF